MEHTAETYRQPHERGQSWTSPGPWFSVLIGPIAWIIGLNLSFGMVQVACAEQYFLPLHLVSVTTLAIALSGGYVGLREWRGIDGSWPFMQASLVARRRLMSALGILNSVLFSLVIFGQWMANVFWNPCMGM